MQEDKFISVEDRVRTIIVDHLGVEQEKVTPEANFCEDLGADSIDEVELIMGFEEEFDIIMSDEDAAKIKTLGQATAYIEAALQKATADA